MESFINILSLNIGLSSTLAGLGTLATINKLDLIVLQEVRVSQEHIDNMLVNLGFQSIVNIDPTAPSKPGTAVAWKKSLPVQDVFNLVTGRLQVVLFN